MKNLKYSLIIFTKISLLCLAFFLLSPSVNVQAVFSDTANANMGIKLELGTVGLAATDIKTIGSVNYSGGEPIIIASKKLLNDGSLSAKLAYKIVIRKADGTVLGNEELSGVSVLLNFGEKAKEVSANVTALKTNSFTFVKDTNNKDVIIDPGETEGIPVVVHYKSNAPTESEKLTVEVTFRLIQSNAANANAKIFSDEESFANTVTLVPKSIDGSYWPKSTFKKSKSKNFSYNVEKMNMVFSETYDTLENPNKKVENLNKAILYIQFNNSNEKISALDIATSIAGNVITKDAIEIDEKLKRVKISFNLNDTYSNPNPNSDTPYKNSENSYSLDLNINVKKNNEYYDTCTIQDKLFATRLVLSSDVPSLSISSLQKLPIVLKTEEKGITFKKYYPNAFNWTLSPLDFEDVSLIQEEFDLEVTGDKNSYVSKGAITDKGFNLRLNSANFTGATLNVKITGNTGHTLVISRKLETEIKSKSMSMRSVEVPIVDEEAKVQPEQQKNPEMEVEEPEAILDSTVQDEPLVEVPLEEEVAEEKTIDDTSVIEETEEVVESSTSESNAESNVDTTIPVENLK